jgi:hypothetical protein
MIGTPCRAYSPEFLLLDGGFVIGPSHTAPSCVTDKTPPHVGKVELVLREIVAGFSPTHSRRVLARSHRPFDILSPSVQSAPILVVRTAWRGGKSHAE